MQSYGDLDKARQFKVFGQPELITNMHMEYAKTLDQALRRAYEIEGKDAKVVVIPDGIAVIVQ